MQAHKDYRGRRGDLVKIVKYYDSEVDRTARNKEWEIGTVGVITAVHANGLCQVKRLHSTDNSSLRNSASFWPMELELIIAIIASPENIKAEQIQQINAFNPEAFPSGQALYVSPSKGNEFFALVVSCTELNLRIISVGGSYEISPDRVESGEYNLAVLEKPNWLLK